MRGRSLRRRTKLRLLSGLVIIFIAAFLAAYNVESIVTYLCSGKDVADELWAGENRSIIIKKERCFENNQAMYYEVREGTSIIVPTTYLHGFDGSQPYEFKIVYAENQSLVGVVETKQGAPAVLIIQDFTKGETFPRPGDDENWDSESYVKRAQSLYERLKRENPQMEALNLDE